MDVLIVEDESLSAQKLQRMLEKSKFDINITGVTSSIKETVKFLMKNTVDLIFLDIQLEDGISFKIFEQIDIDTPVIFTTAYDNYAIKAFELNSIDYLLKPVSKSKLNDAVEKYKKRSVKIPDINDLKNLLDKKEYKKRFLVNVGMKIKTINTDDIAYFYAYDKSVFMTTYDKSRYTIDYTLENLNDELPPDKFFRINRKFIINIKAISNMITLSRSRIKIELDPPPPKDIEAIVSVDRSGDFKDWLDK